MGTINTMLPDREVALIHEIRQIAKSDTVDIEMAQPWGWHSQAPLVTPAGVDPPSGPELGWAGWIIVILGWVVIAVVLVGCLAMCLDPEFDGDTGVGSRTEM